MIQFSYTVPLCLKDSMNFLAKNKDFHVCAEFLTLNFLRFSNWEFLASNWEEDSFWHWECTPGNIVKGSQKLCKGNLYGCNWPWLTALEKCRPTGECSCSCIILTRLQLDFGQMGNVVLSSIPFCTKEKMAGHGKTSGQFLIYLIPSRV